MYGNEGCFWTHAADPKFTAEYLAGFTRASKVSSVTTGMGESLLAADKEGPLRRTLDGMLHTVYGAFDATGPICMADAGINQTCPVHTRYCARKVPLPTLHS